jgi:hypothetical protein
MKTHDSKLNTRPREGTNVLMFLKDPDKVFKEFRNTSKLMPLMPNTTKKQVKTE